MGVYYKILFISARVNRHIALKLAGASIIKMADFRGSFFGAMINRSANTSASGANGGDSMEIDAFLFLA